MKAYRGYSRAGGAAAGAILIFAPDIKTARRIAYPVILDFFTDDFLDVGVDWIRSPGEHICRQSDPEKTKKQLPHIVESPETCSDCEMWGAALNNERKCAKCQTQVITENRL